MHAYRDRDRWREISFITFANNKITKLSLELTIGVSKP